MKQNKVIKKYDKLVEKYNAEIDAWNETVHLGEVKPEDKEPEMIDDEEFIDEMKKENQSLQDIIDWIVNDETIDGDDDYLLELVRYALHEKH